MLYCISWLSFSASRLWKHQNEIQNGKETIHHEKFTNNLQRRHFCATPVNFYFPYLSLSSLFTFFEELFSYGDQNWELKFLKFELVFEIWENWLERYGRGGAEQGMDGGAQYHSGFGNRLTFQWEIAVTEQQGSGSEKWNEIEEWFWLCHKIDFLWFEFAQKLGQTRSRWYLVGFHGNWFPNLNQLNPRTKLAEWCLRLLLNTI